MAPQNVPCPANPTESSAAIHQTPKPRSAPQRLLDWARSALGLRRGRDRSVEAAAAQAAAAAAAAGTAPATAADAPGRLRLAIVGDVHGQWRDEREEAALRLLAPDLTLLVGDFGNEDVGLVRRVAALPLPKAVILGNHDAWYTMTGRAHGPAGRGGVQQTQSAADLLAALERGRGGGGGGGAAAAVVEEGDGVRQQLAVLGTCHVGYGTKRLDERGYTVMGARPFSKGGKNFSTIRPFMEGLYGVTSMDESARRIVQVAESAPAHHALIVMGHNGPTGLGSRAFDICGVDWESKAGDHGDPDLQTALAAIHKAGRRVALVTFGHMHHMLNYANNRGRTSRHRRMVALDPATGTVFLNAATVPRVTSAPTTAPKAPPPPLPRGASSSPSSPKSYGSGRRARMAAKAAAAAAAAAAATGAAAAAAAAAREGDPATAHHFMVAELEQGEVVSARDVWVQVTPVTDSTAAAVLEAAAASVAAVAVEAAAEATSAAGSGEEDGGSSGTEDGGSSDTAPNVASAAAAPARRIGDFVVQVIREHVVLRTVVGADGGVVKFVWNAYDQMYEPVVLAGGSHGGRADPGSRGIGGGGGGEGECDGGVIGHLSATQAAEATEAEVQAPKGARDGAARNGVRVALAQPVTSASVSG